MLHDQDKSMILKNLEDPNSLWRMDLETGKVVDEWKVSDYVQVDNFVPDSKYAQTTAQQTLIGHCTSFHLSFFLGPKRFLTTLRSFFWGVGTA